MTAFTAVYEEMKHQLHNKASYSMRQPYQDPEDLVQETFLKAWMNWESFSGQGSIGAWLRTIMRNLYIDSYRKHKDMEIAAGLADGESAWLDHLAAPVGRDSDLAMDVDKALEELPADFLAAIQLVDLQDLSLNQASALSGVPTGTLKSRRARAREILQGSLALNNQTAC